ncbi:hypothetical protein [Burkholderia sp. LMU1-1-1.1]|uniref:hypothetical protein n=1 Tax=Burkholderia sp. LMU1-1-1.1 TaxID=3135266 RepID=UPI0034241064
MHAFFHTRFAPRRSIWSLGARRRTSAPVVARSCVMQLTVDTGAVTALRQVVMRLCGDSLEFMRIEACEHGARMKVWLCVGTAMVARVMEAVMRSLPGAEFGRFVERPAP